MKKILPVILFLITLFTLSQTACAMERYFFSAAEYEKVKAPLDDPRPYLKDTSYFKTYISEEAWRMMVVDEEEGKKAWSEVVGFVAPDVVGEAFPEIKPGKYTLADKSSYPFDKLMLPYFYERFNTPGEGERPNHIGYFTEFEVVPTRQYYWAPAISEATMKNIGKKQQDDKGYILEGESIGYPFPRPSGEHKAMQILYNHQRGYVRGESFIYSENTVGINKNFKVDHKGSGDGYILRLGGRAWFPPYGYLDTRAKNNHENWVWLYYANAPRDFYGNVYRGTTYNVASKDTTFLAYVNMLRRVRKLSSSDKQDQCLGQDISYDDTDLFNQAMTPHIYPYEYRVIEEGEYLVPALTLDGSQFCDSSKGYTIQNLKLERRPMWVVEAKQQDPHYIYSKRVFYVDKETLAATTEMMYDQKGRLYRSSAMYMAFIKPLAYTMWNMWIMSDHIDTHSTILWGGSVPTPWLSRKDVSLKNVMRSK